MTKPSKKRLAFAVALAAGASLASFLVTSTAEACGGLFCNGPPPNPFTPLPVAQNGENVVFAITKDPMGGAPTLEAHIQILYTGDAAKFSWVVPVDAAPTLGTGTDRLFSALAGVTQPSFQTSYQQSGTCIEPPQMTYDAGTNPGSASGTAGSGAAGASGGGPGVMVSFQGAVGPYEAAVIKSDDPTALKKWLTDNLYVVTDQASGLIDTYVRENKYFVALRLMNGVGVSAIQPIVLTFRGTEACVPLRLTAIAANPDMPVLVWVLGDTRVAPRGYYEIVIDDASIDWERAGSNYFGATGLVSRAANEAGGNAFVTEYAGPSDIARQSVYTNGQINLTTLGQAMIPPAYVQLLAQMGLANDPLILPLLAKYIPMPDAVKKMGVTDVQFYGNISAYWNQFAFPPYDLAGLTDAISMSIVTPRMNAQMMLDAHPMLTRLNTFISPEEMTEDPFFFETQSLPNLSSRHTATIRTMCGNRQFMACNAPRRLELADGRFIWLNKGVAGGTVCQYPVSDLSDLKTVPTLQVAFERELMGAGTRVIDNVTTIGKAIDTHNKKYATETTMFPPPPMGAGGAGGGGFDAAGAPGASGTGAGGEAGHAVTQVSNGGGGCGCGVADGDGGGLAFLAVAASLRLVLARRRRG